jgi:hypothetical protein
VKSLWILVGLVLGFAAGVHFARPTTSDILELSRLNERSHAQSELTTKLSEEFQTNREVIEKLVDRLRARGSLIESTVAPSHPARMIEL